MAEPVIKHGIYRYKTGELDNTGNPVYNTVYFRSDLESIKIVSFDPLDDLDSIPEIDAETQSALELLQIIEAATRKLDRDKLDKSETATTATPNKLLYLDENGQLQATVQNSLSLGGVSANQYALKTDIPDTSDFLTSSDLASYVTTSQLSSTLADYVTSSSLSSQLSNYIKTSAASTTATANKLLYLDANGKLQATANNADNLGGVAASQYALKSDITSNSAFDSNGHLVSPSGWTLWITN